MWTRVVGVAWGFLWSSVSGDRGVPLSHILPRGHQLLNSLKMLELHPRGRIVTPTLGARLQGHIPFEEPGTC